MNKEKVVKLIEKELPEFVKAVKYEEANTICVHQSAFSENDLELLGAAIKYAGYFNKDINIFA